MKKITPKSIDYQLFALIIGLLSFGLIMVSSVSVYTSFRISETNDFFLWRSLMYAFIGCGSLVIFSKIPYKIYENYMRPVFVCMILVLLWVLFFGQTLNGARGWIDIPGLPSIQPTEFLKLAFILYIAFFLKSRQGRVHTLQDGLVPFVSIVGIITVLVGAQPDFGTLMVILPVASILFFIGGGNLKHIAAIVLSISLLFGSIYAIGGSYDKTTNTGRNQLSYIHDRVNAFLEDKEKFQEKCNTEACYQIKNSLIAIGSGGALGLGFGKSIQKNGYLPEPQGDFIFAVIIEELGMIGAFMLVGAYLFFLYKGFYIGSRSQDLFGKYCAYGISSWIGVQAFINMGVNLNIFPLTGITLPLVSYGGSSMLSIMIACGVLLNISRYTRDADSSPSRVGTTMERRTIFR